MADVRARVHLKVGSKSDIEAELLSFNGLKTEKEHVALSLNPQISIKRHLSYACTRSV